MKKITFLFFAVFCSVLSYAQTDFPTETGPIIVSDGTPVIVTLNDIANGAGIPAGTYDRFSVVADWVAIGFAWSSEEELSVVTAAGATPAIGATTGASNTEDPTVLEFGDAAAPIALAGPYDPSIDGSFDLSLTRTYTADSEYTNIVVTLYPAPTCTPADITDNGVTDDCVAGTFIVSLDINVFGDLLDITLDEAGTQSAPFTFVGPSITYEFGPFTIGTPIELWAIHLDPACNFQIGTFSDSCVPDNDDCLNAIPVACLDSVTGSNSAATDTDANGRFDIWYSFTGTVAGDDVTLSLCGSDFDTTLTVFDACSGNEVAFNDDNAAICGPGFRSQLTFTSDGATTYLIRVEGFNTATGNVVLDVSCDSTTPPANDTCLTAITLDCTNNSDSGNTDLASDDDADGFSDVWYVFDGSDLNAGNEVTVSLCGSGFDTILTIYDSCGGAVVADNDDSCGLQSEATFISDGVGDYLIRIQGFNGATGAYDINVSCLSTDPPANDTCLSAEAIACSETVSGDTSFATDSDANGSFDVWYSYTDTVVGDNVTASLCGSGFDTIITVFDACGGVEVASNDDDCGLQSQVSWASDGVTTYLIRVEGFNTATGAYDLAITCDSQAPPANDEAAGAIALPNVVGSCDTPVLGTNIFATDSAEAGASCGTPEGDVWFTVVVPTSGIISVQTSNADGTISDTVMSIYRGLPGSLVELECDDDDAPGLFSQIELDATDGISPGDVLYVRVWEFGNNDKGNFNICAWPATLGVEDNTLNEFSYFPNPVKNTLTLNAQDTIEDVTMYNMLGQVVLRATPNAVTSEVNMSALANGAYFVQVTIANTTQTVRVIKQ
jgi:hypothetical protein